MTATTLPWEAILTSLWHCPACNALFRETRCPLCAHELRPDPAFVGPDGHEHPAQLIMAGAMPWSTYALLDQIRIEWRRPIDPSEGGHGRPGAHFVIVLLYWTLFEVLMDRFYRAAFADLPGKLEDELLRRAGGIAQRIERLYRSRWGVALWDDFKDLGFADVADHMQRVHKARNAFIHGNPAAIDDGLVQATVGHLTATQNAWVAAFNRRCTGMTKKVQIWESDRGSA